jgi:NAD(P)-dependent dehydrogenase (short-subunit alcohol dehydrogenase family)
MDLLGKSAIVTGAGGGGCGRAIAMRLAAEGAAVAVADVNETSGRETVRHIAAAGGRAAFFQADVRHEAEVRALVAAAETTFGGLDVLVNDASLAIFPETSLDDWFANVAVDLIGAMYAIRHGVEAMRRRGGGAIVNIGSVSALCHGGRESQAPGYDTAKAGVMRLTTAFGPQAARERIRINCLVPGWIGSPPVKAYWESLTPEQRQAREVPSVLLGVEEIAEAVVRLIADERLAGRVLVWWNGQPPALIPIGDPGYVRLEPL